MRGAAWPSPNGKAGRAIAAQRRRIAAKPVDRGDDPARCRCRPAPSLPLASPSGRSVFSRSTSNGTPSAGASSCMPPELLQDEVGARIAAIIARMATAARPGGCRLAAEQPDACVRGPSDWGGSTTSTRRRASIGQRRSAPAASEVSPSPQFSRRWQVTSSRSGRRGRQRRRGLAGKGRPARPARRCRCCR